MKAAIACRGTWIYLIALSLLVVPVCRLGAAPGEALDAAPADVLWTLLHDEAVVGELGLTAAQKDKWHAMLDPLDLRLWPLRNRSPQGESGEIARQELAAIYSEAKQGAAAVLRPPQAQRLSQIVLRVQGPEALMRDDVASGLKLSESQRAKIRQEIAAAREAMSALRDQVNQGKRQREEAQTEIVRLATGQRDAVAAVLTQAQKQQFAKWIGPSFDLTAIGNTRFKAPELAGGKDDWLGAEPLELESLRGRVVVVHFFAFGCINCIHNYPSYRKWQKELVGDDVVMIGIHTPETKSEHNISTLKQKLQDESLTFPVLVDNDKANWNAWGNHWWPAVYVIDQEGYQRAYWPGELKWQGRDGEAEIERSIHKLLSAGQKRRAQ